MKIKCEYCGSMFDDTLEKCPNCGGTNTNVRRSTDDQPVTIEGLKEWYKAKGLPDEEVTRFFIGRNYMGPKAFGIYKEQNGKFIVYKNKADGTRAVRYEGTDEAYAVNELLTRLKQEILEQKGRAVKKNPAPVNKSVPLSDPVMKTVKPAGASETDAAPQKTLSPEETKKAVLTLLIAGAVLIAAIVGIVSLVKAAKAASIPYMGYYAHNDELYYHCEETPYNWMRYDKAARDWTFVSDIDVTAKELLKRKTAAQYYLGENYDASFGASDVADSLEYKDYLTGYIVERGYYDYEDTVYYHNAYTRDYNWYYYDAGDDDWITVPEDMLPDALTHQTIAQDFWYTPEWDSETQITDFEESAAFREYNADTDDDDSWWGSGSDSSSTDDYDWDWSSDSWDSGSTDWDSDW